MLPTDDQTETTTTDPLDGDGFGQFGLETTHGHRVTSRLCLGSDSERQGETGNGDQNVLVAHEVLRLEKFPELLLVGGQRVNVNHCRNP